MKAKTYISISIVIIVENKIQSDANIKSAAT